MSGDYDYLVRFVAMGIPVADGALFIKHLAKHPQYQAGDLVTPIRSRTQKAVRSIGNAKPTFTLSMITIVLNPLMSGFS